MARLKKKRQETKSTKRFLTTTPRDQMARGPNGRRLCRWCQTEVPKGRITFCSQQCVHEWNIRADASYMRMLVEERDKGVCAGCGMDTKQLDRIFQKLLRRCRLNGWGKRVTTEMRELMKERYINAEKRLAKLYQKFPWAFDKWWVQNGKHFPHDRTFWQADHIIPVAEGGGQCGLENIRTLCLGCHKIETARLRKRLSQRKKIKLKKRK